MKIVENDVSGKILAVTTGGFTIPNQSPDTYTVHDVPDWDWSLANLDGVDRTQENWIREQLVWDGTTLVKRT